MRNKLLKIALSLFIASFILAGFAGTSSAAETLTITSVTQQASDPVTYAKICFQYSNPTAITSGAQMLEGYYNVSGSTWTYFQVVESERRKYPCQIFQLPTKLGAGVYNVRIRIAGTSIYSNVMQLRIGKFIEVNYLTAAPDSQSPQNRMLLSWNCLCYDNGVMRACTTTEVTSFDIYRGASATALTKLGSIPNTNTQITKTFADTGLSPKTTYYYKVVALPSNSASNIANATTASLHSISGLVKYRQTDTPIAGVKVELVNPVTNAVIATTTSGDNGSYLFQNLNTGTYALRVTLGDKTIEPNDKVRNPVVISNAGVAGVNFLFNVPLRAEVVTTQVIDLPVVINIFVNHGNPFNKLVKNKPTMFRVTLYPVPQVDDGKEFKNIKVELKADQELGGGYSGTISGTMYSYQGRLYGEAVSNDDQRKEVRNKGKDAVQLALPEGFKPTREGKLAVKAAVYMEGESNCTAQKEYTVQQQAMLNIGVWMYDPVGVKLDVVRREVASLFPIAEESVKFKGIKMLDWYSQIWPLLDREGWTEEFGWKLLNLIRPAIAQYNNDNPNKKLDKYIIFFPKVVLSRPGPVSTSEETRKIVGFGAGAYLIGVTTHAPRYTEQVITHELGHTYGFLHPWEYQFAVRYLADEGFDFLNSKRIVNLSPESLIREDAKKPLMQNMGFYWDLMCWALPRWINRENYGDLFDLFQKEDLLSKSSSQPYPSKTAALNLSSSSSASTSGNLYFSGNIKVDTGELTVALPVILADYSVQSPLSGSTKIEAFSADGTLLYTSYANTFPQQAENVTLIPAEGGYVEFCGMVPNDSNITYVRILLNGTEKEKITRTPSNPQIVGNPLVSDIQDKIRISFNLSDKDNPDNLHYSLYYRNSANPCWLPLIFQEKYDPDATVKDFSKADLAGGTCQFKLEASDGLNFIEYVIPQTLTIAHRPPVVSISNPLSGSVYLSGENIRLLAFGMDEEGEEITDDTKYISKAAQGSAVIPLGSGRELYKNDLSLGRYTITSEVTDKNNLKGTSQPVDIEVDDMDKPDVSVLGVEVYPKQLDTGTTRLEVNVSLFNIRKDAMATVNITVAGAVVGTYNLLLPANQITDIPVSFAKPASDVFNLEVQVSGVADELFTANNSMTVYYPITDTAPAIQDILVSPDPLFANERIHVAAKLVLTDGEPVAEYRWTLDGVLLANNNKPTFALSLAAGKHTLKLEVLDVSGLSASLTKTFTVVSKEAPPAPVVTDQGVVTPSLTTLSAFWKCTPPSGVTITEYQYRIYEGDPRIPPGPVVKDWTSTGTNTSVTVTGLSLKTPSQNNNAYPMYYFSVRAKNSFGIWGESGKSDGIIPGCSLPATPVSLVAAATTTKGTVKITWKDLAQDEAGYSIEYTKSSAFTDILRLWVPANTITYKVTGLASKTRYYFRVKAHKTAVVSFPNTAPCTAGSTCSKTVSGYMELYSNASNTASAVAP